MLEPLLDRIEMIHIDEYTLDEKREISEKFLIPSVLKEYGLYDKNSSQTIKFTSEIMEKLIKEYSYYRGGIRGIKKNIEKVIRKANNFLMENINKDIKELILDEKYLNLFLGNAKLYDENQTKILKFYSEPGSVLTADQSGQLVRIFIKEMLNPNRKSKENEAISSDAIFKDMNKITNLDKPVEESLQTALNLAREKLIDLFNETNLKNLIEARKVLLREFNLYMTHPYHEKKGNSYGLAFLISFVSAGLNKKIDHLDYLIAGELSPHGNVLRIRGIRSLLNVCEFYDIKNLILPEGNRADYLKFIENNNKSFNVKFVKNTDEALKFFFKNEFDKGNITNNIEDIILNNGNYLNNNVTGTLNI
jgi:ATP-dependent Lon protease